MNIIRPTVITDAMLKSSTIAEDDEDEYNPATTYGAGDLVMETAAGWHKIYESLQAANTGNALTDTDWWLELGPTNRWKVFDQKVGTQSSKAAHMNFVLEPGIIDSIALLNLDATSVQIIITDPIDGEVYCETINLVTSIPVADWYMYYFEPIIRATDMVKTDLAAIGIPPYTDAEVSITVINSGGTALCGAIVVGMQANLGAIDYGAEASIVDYSVKSTDDFGNFTITERAYSKRNTYDLTIFNTVVDEVYRILALYRATPVVYVGAEEHTMFIIYGFWKDFRIVLRYPAYSICSLDIEGLT